MAETAQNNKKPAKVESNDRLQWLRDKGFIKTLELKNDKGQVVETAETVIYKGLLALAHEDGLKRLVTEMVEYPCEDNGHTAIFLAEAETNKGTFRCHGDANPENVDELIAPHFIRNAETRAKARVLRDALNIGLVCAEEFDLEVGSNGVFSVRATNGKLRMLPKEKPESQPKALPAAPAASAPEKPKTSPTNKSGNGPQANAKPKANAEARATSANRDAGEEDPMTEKQRNFLFRLASDRGHSGEEAHQYLKETFGVDTLRKVTKAEAKHMIDQWLREARKEREELPY